MFKHHTHDNHKLSQGRRTNKQLPITSGLFNELTQATFNLRLITQSFLFRRGKDIDRTAVSTLCENLDLQKVFPMIGKRNNCQIPDALVKSVGFFADHLGSNTSFYFIYLSYASCCELGLGSSRGLVLDVSSKSRFQMLLKSMLSKQILTLG